MAESEARIVIERPVTHETVGVNHEQRLLGPGIAVLAKHPRLMAQGAVVRHGVADRAVVHDGRADVPDAGEGHEPAWQRHFDDGGRGPARVTEAIVYRLQDPRASA